MTLPAEAQLDRILGSGVSGGSFFLFGDAVRLRDDAARRLIDAALDPATRDFNLSQFRGDALDAESLAAAIAMPPMMAAQRVVAVFDAHKLTAPGRKIVEGAVKSAPADLVLVITATIPKGSKAAFYRKLREASTSLEWKAPRDAEIPGWLLERARTAHGFELGSEAAQALAWSIGTDLSILDAELSKLASVAVEGPLTLERVRELVPNLRKMDRWAWLDLVATRKYGQALHELDGLLETDSAVGLVAGLVEQHLLIGLARESGEGGVRRVLADTGRGYLSWKAKIYGRQAAGWTGAELQGALRLFRRADRQLKTGGSDRGVLQELLLSLGRRTGQPA
jgi:DNA polymerase-3 subunit delta